MISQQQLDEMLQQILAGRDQVQPTASPDTNYPTGAEAGADPNATQLGMMGQAQIPSLSPQMPRPYAPPPPAPPPTMSPNPDQRMMGWRGLLTNFTFSLASGLEARSKNHRAGVGEALMGPFALQDRMRQQNLAESKLKLDQANEDRMRVASDATMARMNENQLQLPAKIQEMLDRSNLLKSQTATESAKPALIGAQTAEAQAKPALIAAQTASANAETSSRLAEAAAKSFIKVGEKVFSVKDLLEGGVDVKPVADGSDDAQFTVTPELAQGIGQPGLAGHTFTAKVGKELTSILSSATKQASTAEGVTSRNLITGEKTRLGSPIAESRMVSVIGDGGLPKLMPAGEAAKTGAVPGNLADVNKLTGQAATFSNFHSNANRVKELVPVIAQPGATGRIAAAMAQPTSTLGQYVQGQLATGNLTPGEFNLINALSTFKEDSFNLRQFFGNSPVRSNAQVQIMMNQIPSIADLTTGKPEQVLAKIENFERSVHAVEAQFGPLTSLVKKFAQAPTSAPANTSGADAEIVNGKVVIHNNKQTQAQKRVP